MITAIDQMTPDEQARCRVATTSAPVALCTDFDGTISSIAPTPEEAHILPGVVELLEHARARFAVVAVVSGRDVANLWQKVAVPGLTYIGDHGNHAWRASDDTRMAPPEPPTHPAIAAALHDFESAPVSRLPGVRHEAKGVTASIHYRAAPDPEAARDQLLAALHAIAVSNGIRVREGRAVIELQLPTSRDKGDAIDDLITTHELRGLLYLGDDRTDIDAFRAARTARERGRCETCAVAVASPEAPSDLITSADLALQSIDLVPDFLRWLINQS